MAAGRCSTPVRPKKGDQAVVRVDGAVAALGLTGLVAGLLALAPPLRQRGVVAVLELLGGGGAGRQGAGCSAAKNASATTASILGSADTQAAGTFPSTRCRCRCSSSQG